MCKRRDSNASALDVVVHRMFVTARHRGLSHCMRCDRLPADLYALRLNKKHEGASVPVLLKTLVWSVRLVCARFGLWDEIIAEPRDEDPALYPTSLTTAHYARAIAFASKGLVAEAEEEQVWFTYPILQQGP